MKRYNLIFFSRTKCSLPKFLLLFTNCFFLRSRIIKNHSYKKLSKTLFTLLKSPHVNKAAQEHFAIKKFNRSLKCYQLNDSKYFYFIKQLKNNLAFNLSIKISLFFSILNLKSYNSGILNSINSYFSFQFLFFNQKILLNSIKFQMLHYDDSISKKILNSLKILCVYGELKSSEYCLGSSVRLEQKIENFCVNGSNPFLSALEL